MGLAEWNQMGQESLRLTIVDACLRMCWGDTSAGSAEECHYQRGRQQQAAVHGRGCLGHGAYTGSDTLGMTHV